MGLNLVGFTWPRYGPEIWCCIPYNIVFEFFIVDTKLVLKSTGARCTELPLFFTLCLHIYFHSMKFLYCFISLSLVYLCVSIFINLHVSTLYLYIPWIINIGSTHAKIAVNIRLFKYEHAQVQLRKRRWNNKDIWFKITM